MKYSVLFQLIIVVIRYSLSTTTPDSLTYFEKCIDGYVLQANKCVPCRGGSYGVPGSVLCSTCPANTYSLDIAIECTNCTRFSSSLPGSTSCTCLPFFIAVGSGDSLYCFRFPTNQPTSSPSIQPSQQPIAQPSLQPSKQPSSQPTLQPSKQPSSQPSRRPSKQPSKQPTSQPTSQPSCQPSHQPSGRPSRIPTMQPTRQPICTPTLQPSRQPLSQPTSCPTLIPLSKPTTIPTGFPSDRPSHQPSNQPSSSPSRGPSSLPSSQPSQQPSEEPTFQPSASPSLQPSQHPTQQPSNQPSSEPSNQPSEQPTSRPTVPPTAIPSSTPTAQPSRHPSGQPSKQPTTRPSSSPTVSPSSATAVRGMSAADQQHLVTATLVGSLCMSCLAATLCILICLNIQRRTAGAKRIVPESGAAQPLEYIDDFLVDDKIRWTVDGIDEGVEASGGHSITAEEVVDSLLVQLREFRSQSDRRDGATNQIATATGLQDNAAIIEYMKSSRTVSQTQASEEIHDQDPDAEVSMNRSFLFLKPTVTSYAAVRAVYQILNKHNIHVVEQGLYSGDDIQRMRIFERQFSHLIDISDAHPQDLLLSESEEMIFESEFGCSWKDVVNDHNIVTLDEASLILDVDADDLQSLWLSGNVKMVRLRRGFYVTQVKRTSKNDGGIGRGSASLVECEEEEKEEHPHEELPQDSQQPLHRKYIYCINVFYNRFRQAFVSSSNTCHFLSLEWDASLLSYGDFLASVIGDRNPDKAAASAPSSVRGVLCRDWERLGLAGRPNTHDNCVHVSGSGFEAMVERLIWQPHALLFSDPLGCRLVLNGFTAATLNSWVANPIVRQRPAPTKRLFEYLEGLGDEDCQLLIVNLLKSGNAIVKTALGSPKKLKTLNESSLGFSDVSKHFPKRFDGRLEAATLIIKPPCNTPAVREWLKSVLREHSIHVVKEATVTVEEMRERKIFERHFERFLSAAYAVDCRDIQLSAHEAGEFARHFGLSWQVAVDEGRVYGARKAAKLFGISSADLMNSADLAAATTTRLGRGIYCTKLEGIVETFALTTSLGISTPIFCINGFYAAVESTYVDANESKPGHCAHFMSLEWDASLLSYGDFLASVIGDRNPGKAAASAPSSVRGVLCRDWERLGLAGRPNTHDNCVHVSGSGFEAMVERLIWQPHALLFSDPLGFKLLAGRALTSQIRYWMSDPVICDGDRVFDLLRGQGLDQCLSLLLMLKDSLSA